jgi:hypothetical protein
MAEGKQEGRSRIGSSSRLLKMLLVLLAALFTFGGPYVAYVMNHLLDIDYAIALVSGFVSFIVGFVLILYLIKNKVIS